jgi:hypothetical protein
LCTWQIEAPKGYRIELFNFKIELPFTADYASCSIYDYLQLDSLNLNSNPILQICRSNSIKNVMSTENRLFIKFQSNYMDNAKGIQFSARIWG